MFAPSPLQLRLFVALHGHVGWLAVALLAHPALVLRTPKRRAHLAVGLATAGVTLVALYGAVLYVEYRARVRAELFRESPALGWLFERKEHLAFGAVLFAWAGAALYVAARRSSGERQAPLQRASALGFAIAFVMATVAAAFGTIVTAQRTF